MSLKLFVLLSSLVIIQYIHGLPSTTYPISYNLWMNATESWKKENFDGCVEIEIGVAEQTNQIVLSYSFVFVALNYQAQLFEIKGETRVEIETKEIKLENWSEQLVIEIENENVVLEVGKKYLVIVNFTSYFDGAAKGVYFQGESFYEPETHMVATNFLPNYARQAFPCYDEPMYKASIKLTIVHGIQYTAVSNMPVEKLSTDNLLGVSTTIFQATPPLSIHSFGFVISTFRHSAVDKSVKYVAYFDEYHDTDDVELVLSTEDKILLELETYLGAELGLLEIKEVPQYDDMYAKIGTYGLILNDYHYYYCNSSETLLQREEVVRRTARLMANQFFSNLITPKAWEDAWITQGISVLLEYSILGTDFAYLNSMDTFLVKLYKFMGYKRVYYNVGNGDMARNLIDRSFDTKSAEFMYMLQNVMTEEIFHTFLQTLMAEYRNLSLSTAEFLDKLTNVAHVNNVLPASYDFATIMDNWLNHPGSPVLAVTRDYETGKVTLVQHNIIEWGSDEATWWVPYNYLTENSGSDWNTTPNGWIEKTSTLELDLSGKLDSTEWILFNIKQSAYYHTVYDNQNWLLLAAQLSSNHEKVHYINRGHLVSDAFIYGYDKLVSLEVAFASANYLHKEQSTFPFRLLFTDEFNQIDTNLFGTAVYTNYTIFMRYQLRNIYERIRVTRPVEELDFDELTLRSTITKFACRMHLKECLEDAKEISEKYYLDPEQIDAQFESDLGETLLMYGFVMCNETIFWDIFDRINDGENEENYYTNMIGMTKDPVHIQYLVDILMTANDEKYIGTTINLGRYVRSIIFETIINNNYEVLDLFYEMLDKQSDLVSEIYDFHYSSIMVKDLFRRTTTEERLEKITALAVKYETNVEDYSNDISKARRIIDWNIERTVEFRDLLASYTEKIQNEEAGNGDGNATSLTVSILIVLALPMFVTFFA